MPYQSRPISEAEIDALPLRFVKLEQGEEETFTDVLLKVWCALGQSGSLATLPPVPDVVSFIDTCTIFYLIFHTNPSELKLAPGDRLTSAPPSPPPKPANPSKARLPKRPHPYAHARPRAPSPVSFELGSPSSSKPSTDPSSLSDEVIGCVYLSYSSSTQSTLDIGIALRPEARGRGFGRATITKFLRLSFDTLRVHRVVANVFGPSDINQRQSARESGSVRWIFEKIGFVPEGVQRRAAFSAAEGIWRDVYPLAMLDVDWLRLCGRRPEGRTGITSPFDAMMERHNSEREEMSEWMDDPSWGRLRRVSSTETIKGNDPATQEPPTKARSPSPTQSESSFSIPSEHDWRSATPSTDSDFSVVSHSPPPEVGSPSASDEFSTFSLSNATSPRFDPSTPNSEPTAFSMIGSADLDPPLSPGFSNTGDDIIELSSWPRPVQALDLDPRVTSTSSSRATRAPYVFGPLPTPPSQTAPTPDEPLDYWSSDSEFDGSARDQ